MGNKRLVFFQHCLLSHSRPIKASWLLVMSELKPPTETNGSIGENAQINYLEASAYNQDRLHLSDHCLREKDGTKPCVTCFPPPFHSGHLRLTVQGIETEQERASCGFGPSHWDKESKTEGQHCQGDLILKG